MKSIQTTDTSTHRGGRSLIGPWLRQQPLQWVACQTGTDGRPAGRLSRPEVCSHVELRGFSTLPRERQVRVDEGVSHFSGVRMS